MGGGWRVWFGILLVTGGTASNAGDWPQILGPKRDGWAEGEQISLPWPASGPRLVWQRPCGRGFAGVAVRQKLGILFHRLDDAEYVTAFEAATGRTLWEQHFPTNYRAQIVEDDGPRCVPTLADDTVVVLGAEGGLHALRLHDGQVLWSHALAKEFQAPEGYFGFGSAPLVVGDRVIVNVGGPQGAGVVAFALDDGRVLWKQSNELASYSAPIVYGGPDAPLVLMVTRLHFLGLDPLTGRERFRLPFGMRGPTVNAASPVVWQDHVLLTASYGIGARWIHLHPQGAELVWEDEIPASQYTTPVVFRGVVYALDGRQDVGTARLLCFDPSTRRILWSQQPLNYGTLVAAGDKLLLQQTEGTLRVMALDPTSYRELARHRLLSGTTRALPAFAAGRWFLRNENTLACFELTASSDH